MPRIRTIKPDFWSDASVVELSMPARLFFIGTWNFADDAGNLEYSTRQLKMRIFPADAIDIQPLIDELTTTGMLIEYQVDGKKYLNIKNFRCHQVINKPSKTRLPSIYTTTPLPYGREGKGRERKGESNTLSDGSPDSAPNGFSPDDMVRLWNDGIEFFGKDQAVLVPKIMKLTDERRKKAHSRIKDCQVDEPRWRSVINAVHQSDHLSGRKPSKGYENWTASFDFVVRSQTILMKILEGGYR